MRVSVVIPSRDESIGLWATVAAAKTDLELSDIWPNEIIIVENSDEPSLTASEIGYWGLARVFFPGKTFQSPQAARNFGFQHSTGEIVFFLDSHVIVPSGFFRTVLEDMEKTRADLMHSPYRYSGNVLTFEPDIDWNGFLWYKKHNGEPAYNSKPYQVAIGNHGGVAVRRESFSQVGCYWGWLKGFGGEESELNLKLWFLGKSCWITPRTYHWHYLCRDARRNDENMLAAFDWTRNFLGINFCFGGEAQMHAAYTALRRNWKSEWLHKELLSEIPLDPEVNRQRKWLFDRAKFKDLSELRAWMRTHDVVN